MIIMAQVMAAAIQESTIGVQAISHSKDVIYSLQHGYLLTEIHMDRVHIDMVPIFIAQEITSYAKEILADIEEE